MKRLNGWDAMLLYSETPNIHTHTLKIGVIDAADFDGDFTFEVFRRTLRRRLHLLEPLRYRLIDIPLKLHHPMWLEKSDIDLDYHLRRVRVRRPGGRRELNEVIGEIASTPLDRSRPLWEMHFVEGMADNRFAVIGKVHHALADGVASANLMAKAMDLKGPIQDERDLYATNAPPSTGELLAGAWRDHMKQLGRLPRLARETAAGISRVRARGKERGEHPELAKAFSPPPTFFNHVVSPGRRFGTATLALSDVKETSKRLGITINDLVLATAAGALRELLLRYDGRADAPLIASVPASLNTSAGPTDRKRVLRVERVTAGARRRPARAGAADVAGHRDRQRGLPPDRAGCGEPVGGVSPTERRACSFPLAVEAGGTEQAAERADLERARAQGAGPARRRDDQRNLFCRTVDRGQWHQHHGVELRRPAQHLGADRRHHPRRSA